MESTVLHNITYHNQQYSRYFYFFFWQLFFIYAFILLQKCDNIWSRTFEKEYYDIFVTKRNVYNKYSLLVQTFRAVKYQL